MKTVLVTNRCSLGAPSRCLVFTAIVLHWLQESPVCAASDEKKSPVAIEITEAKFIASNAIRVNWNATISFSSVPFNWRLTLRNEANGTTLANATAAASKRRFTFWNVAVDAKNANYSVSVALQPTSRTSWTDQLSSSYRSLSYEVVQPVTLSGCQIYVRNGFTRRLDITKTTDVVFEPQDFIVISCEMSGYPIPRVRWFKDEKSDETVAANYSLTLSNARNTSEGLHWLISENSFGIAVFPGVRLKMAVLETFSSPNESPKLTVEVGVGQTIDCRYNGKSVPEATFRWYKLTHRNDPNPNAVIPDNSRVLMSVTGSLVFVNTELPDSSIYMCMVINPELDRSIAASLTQLEVIESRYNNFSVGPQLLFKSLEIQEVFIGEHVTIQCVFSGRPIPETLWYFKDPMTSLYRRSIDESRFHLRVNNRTLIILNVNESSPKQFRCEGRNSEGISQPVQFQLFINGKPEFLIAPQSINATVGDNVTFIYKARGHPTPDIFWSRNGKPLVQNSNVLINETSLTLVNVTTEWTSSLQLNISNSHGWRLANVVLIVFVRTKIVALAKERDERGFLSFPCDAETDPSTPLEVKWLRNDRPLSSPSLSALSLFFRDDQTNHVNDDEPATLIVDFKEIEQNEDEGQRLRVNFTCFASNGLTDDSRTVEFVWGKASKPPTAEIKQPNGDDITDRIAHGPFIYLGYVACSVVLLLIVLTVALRLRTQRVLLSRSMNSPAEDQRGRQHPGTTASSTVIATGTSRLVTDFGPGIVSKRSFLFRGSRKCSLRYNNRQFSRSIVANDNLRGFVMTNYHDLFIPRDRLHVTETIAEGRFTDVSLAFLHDPRAELRETIAVKALKSEFLGSDVVDLYIREAQVTVSFQHVNVLRSFGLSMEHDGRPLIVQPFMSNGDLRSYIMNPRMDLTVLHLLEFGLQVVRGMVYLSILPVVHCHLRTKACMVNSRGIVKVSDFGLTRELIIRDQQYEPKHVMRWMSPETLEAYVFSTMSDVWSFGMLLWELMTRGAPPFGEMKVKDILKNVQSGQRPDQPTFCPEEIYSLMVNCWSLDPLQRPNFSYLEEVIYRIVHYAHRRGEGGGGEGGGGGGSQTSQAAVYVNLIAPPNDFNHLAGLTVE